MKKGFIKVLTVILFVVLIISFITYRTGYFDEKIEPNTTIVKDSIVKIEALSSSKSLILIDHYEENDTIISENSTKEDTLIDLQRIMSSSKSMIILESEDLKLLKRDSISNDSIENK